jgi:MFS family permease
MLYGGLMAFVGLWGVPYLRQGYGMSRIEASNFIGLVTIVLLIASPSIGWLSDRWGRRRPPLIAATALSVAAWALLVGVPAPLPRLVLGGAAILLGVGGAGVVIVFASLREVSDPRHVGVTLGLHNLPIFLNFALMQWLTGVVLDARWDGSIVDGARVYSDGAYRAAFALCLGAAVCSLITATRVRETYGRSIWTSRVD